MYNNMYYICITTYMYNNSHIICIFPLQFPNCFALIYSHVSSIFICLCLFKKQQQQLYFINSLKGRILGASGSQYYLPSAISTWKQHSLFIYLDLSTVSSTPMISFLKYPLHFASRTEFLLVFFFSGGSFPITLTGPSLFSRLQLPGSASSRLGPYFFNLYSLPNQH